MGFALADFEGFFEGDLVVEGGSSGWGGSGRGARCSDVDSSVAVGDVVAGGVVVAGGAVFFLLPVTTLTTRLPEESLPENRLDHARPVTPSTAMTIPKMRAKEATTVVMATGVSPNRLIRRFAWITSHQSGSEGSSSSSASWSSLADAGSESGLSAATGSTSELASSRSEAPSSSAGLPASLPTMGRLTRVASTEVVAWARCLTAWWVRTSERV